jgi:recombination protein RecR
LVQRVAGGTVREVIMGTNPTLEGDGTTLHIQSLLARWPQVTVTRLARGLPAGSSIEYANKNILADAIAGRQKI